jgi:isopenicillin N synthase-like dioxygenase
MTIPLIDLARLERERGLAAVAAAVGAACRGTGFFYPVGRGVETALRERLFGPGDPLGELGAAPREPEFLLEPARFDEAD